MTVTRLLNAPTPKEIDKSIISVSFGKFKIFRRKTKMNVEYLSDIDTASEIAYATLAEVMDNINDERTQYVLLGVLQQLETIKKSVTNFDLKAQGGAA